VRAPLLNHDIITANRSQLRGVFCVSPRRWQLLSVAIRQWITLARWLDRSLPSARYPTKRSRINSNQMK